MLEKQDFEMLQHMMREVVDESIAKNNEVFGAELEERIKEQTCKQIETAIAKSESLLLDEMERYHNISQNEIKKLNRKMDEITEYYRIKHLNDDVCDTLLLLYRKQQGEIENIKKVIAV